MPSADIRLEPFGTNWYRIWYNGRESPRIIHADDMGDLSPELYLLAEQEQFRRAAEREGLV